MDEPQKKCPGPLCKGQIRPVSAFLNKPKRANGLSSWCRECHNWDIDQREARWRAQAFEVLGGRCKQCVQERCEGSCCTDVRALQIDHVYGGGNDLRKAGETGIRLYKAVLAEPERFQLLCANHNHIKRIENREFRKDYARTIPSVIRAVDRAEADRQRGATVKERWAEKTSEEMAAIVARRSATMEAKRAKQLEIELELPIDPSWTRLRLDGCFDCGTHVKPHVSRGMCSSCYMRDYYKRKRESS